MNTPHWFQLIDLYCERTQFLFWAEPVNAASNVFLLLAGVLGFFYLAKTKDKKHRLWIIVLSTNAIFIAVGSFLFHTLATYWAMLADVIPITLFMFLFLIFCLKNLMLLSTLASGLWVSGFVLIGFVLEFLLPKSFLNGSGSYIHALATLAIIAVLLRRSQPLLSRAFMLATLTFSLSLGLRTLDMTVCESFPLGTHFLWHTLNGLLLLICIRIVYLNSKMPIATKTTP